MITSRLIYVSSEQRITALAGQFALQKGSIRQGDYLFCLDQPDNAQTAELKRVCSEAAPLLKCLFNSADRILLKIIPEPELQTVLSAFNFYNRPLAVFFEKVSDYFFRRQKIAWHVKDRVISFAHSPLIMGILNVTPDSFSDGGLFFDREKAVDHALAMAADGADIIDIGGESTRPGAQKVAVQDELKRVIPVIEAVRKHSDIPLSIDSYKSVVAEAALQSGADIINDISGMTFDEHMLTVIGKYSCPYVLMHIQGSPDNMQQKPFYKDVHHDVYHFLSKKCEIVASANDGKVIVDPGFGFGKSIEHNLLLLRDLADFTFIGKPILVGVSRKSFIGKILETDAGNRLAGTLAAQCYASLRNAGILRVHDVGAAIKTRKMLNHILAA